MKKYKWISLILLVLGILTFAYQGISFTIREKVVDTGPTSMTAEETRTRPLPPSGFRLK